MELQIVKASISRKYCFKMIDNFRTQAVSYQRYLFYLPARRVLYHVEKLYAGTKTGLQLPLAYMESFVPLAGKKE